MENNPLWHGSINIGQKKIMREQLKNFRMNKKFLLEMRLVLLW